MTQFRKWAYRFADFLRDSINMMFPGKVFINQNAKIFNIFLGFKRSIFIFLIVK